MTLRSLVPISLLACACLGSRALADAWDGADELPAQTLHDLGNGFEETHDLAGRAGSADADWWTFLQEPYTSYEVIVDGIGGEPVTAALSRWDKYGTTQLQASAPVNGSWGTARILRWMNDTAAPVLNHIRVGDAPCAAQCTSNSRYRIRAAESTLAFARFNGTNGSYSILRLGNLRNSSIQARVTYWSTSGAVLLTEVFSIAAHAVASRDLGFPPLVALNGSITIAHDAGAGNLAAQLDSVDSTGALRGSMTATAKSR